MKILLIIAIIAFIALSIWFAKRKGITDEYNPKSKLILIENDNPVDFGYKTVWLAVKTDNKKRISEILKLKNTKECNWKVGIAESYNSLIYITPQIKDWTLVFGLSLSKG